MRRVAILVLLSVAALVANPTIDYFLSEIQASPDSLERVEIYRYASGLEYPIDLSGCQIVTKAGTATIDSGVVLEDSGDFVVISRENTHGTFSLGDSADSVCLVGLGDVAPYAYGDDGWAPPSGMSAAAYTSWEGIWPYEYVVCCWYLDSTPTFGAPNDDRYGGIAGRVHDRHGLPLPWCIVSFRNARGRASLFCDSTGRFTLSPLGPGSYEVSARSDSSYLPACYPESVSIGTNEWRDSINMTLYPAGVAEEPSHAAQQLAFRQRGRSLILTADRPGTACVMVYDNLGRVRMSERIAVVSGGNELALSRLRSGVYFASCRLGERTLKTKLVLY